MQEEDIITNWWAKIDWQYGKNPQGSPTLHIETFTFPDKSPSNDLCEKNGVVQFFPSKVGKRYKVARPLELWSGECLVSKNRCIWLLLDTHCLETMPKVRINLVTCLWAYFFTDIMTFWWSRLHCGFRLTWFPPRNLDGTRHNILQPNKDLEHSGNWMWGKWGKSSSPQKLCIVPRCHVFHRNCNFEMWWAIFYWISLTICLQLLIWKYYFATEISQLCIQNRIVSSGCEGCQVESRRRRRSKNPPQTYATPFPQTNLGMDTTWGFPKPKAIILLHELFARYRFFEVDNPEMWRTNWK